MSEDACTKVLPDIELGVPVSLTSKPCAKKIACARSASIAEGVFARIVPSCERGRLSEMDV
jgi:hypothetical protein